MKRLYISFAIIILILAFSVWSYICVNTKLDSMLSAIEKDDISVAEVWKKEKNFLSVILRNDVMNDINNEINILQNAISNGDKDSADESRAAIESYIKTIKDRENISPGNIF